MSEKKPPAFDRSDRARSLEALDLVQRGVAATAQGTDSVQAAQTHPQLGDLIVLPRKEVMALLNQFYVTLEFSRDMVEQLASLERKTGTKADLLALGTYAGVIIPKEAKSLSMEGSTLYMQAEVPSSLVPTHMLSVNKEVATAGVPTPTGEIFTLEQLKAAKEEFDAERSVKH